MSYYSKRLYVIKKIEKSSNPKKKYQTVLVNKKTGKQVIIRWGSVIYQQYKDKTPLKLYSHLDHTNKERRRLYHARHKHFIRKGYYSAGDQSMRFLW